MQESREQQMKKFQKILGILAAGIIILLTTKSYAAKVCVANGVVRNIYLEDQQEYDHYVYDNLLKDWYCNGSKSSAPSVIAGKGNHGNSTHCWCFANGAWSYLGNYDSGTCKPFCPALCGV
jgi:hypothetical protein